GLGSIFGWQRYIVPLYLAVIGYLLLFPEKYHLAPARWFGFGLMLVASEAFLQLFLPLDTSIKQAIDGQGGGYLGVLLNYPLRSALGSIATAFLLFGLTVVGWLIMFNTSLNRLGGLNSIFGRWVASWRGRSARHRLAVEADELQKELSEVEPEFTKREMTPPAPPLQTGGEASSNLDHTLAGGVAVPPPAPKKHRPTIAV